jgi:hypothetical protein
MSAVAHTSAPSTRRNHQHRVATLLEEVAARRERLYALQAHGARPAGLRGLKVELAAVRDELASVVQASGRSVAH